MYLLAYAINDQFDIFQLYKIFHRDPPHKGGARMNSSHFCPICRLSTLSKLVEKTVERMPDYLTTFIGIVYMVRYNIQSPGQ